MGIGYLVSAVRKVGHDVEVYDMNIYHLPVKYLKDYLEKTHFDVVGIGMIAGYHQYKKIIEISEAITSVQKRPLFVIGGHMFAPDPEYFIKRTGADVVVIGEAEISFINLLDAFASNRNFSEVKGIAYVEGNKVVVNERERLIENLDSIEFPGWDAFNMEYYTLMRNPRIKHWERSFQVIASRGCVFTCNFCYRMDKGFRHRSPENIIEEINKLQVDYHVNYINFTDELLTSSKRMTIKFCEALIKSGLNINFFCNGRLDFASKEVVKLLKTAGCVYINYGIESLDDEVLEKMNKKLTVDQIRAGIKNTIEAGIHPGFNIIFGNIGDTKETLRKSVEFLLKYTTYTELRTIRPVTPYPGSPLFYSAIEMGLLKNTEDFYEHKHVNSDLLAVNFTELSDKEFYNCLFDANKVLIEDYFKKSAEDNIKDFYGLYFEGDTSYRGPRQT